MDGRILGALMIAAAWSAAAQPASEIVRTPVRNDVAQAGREVLVLRKHRLQLGGHEPFYQSSRDDVWPYFERMGARVVGQWRITQSDAMPPQAMEDVYRLVRYASVEHWQATRSQRSVAGDGPALEKDLKGRRERATLEVQSPGAYFLEGEMAPGGPYFMPAVREKYELVRSGEWPPSTQADVAVRIDVARPGVEIVVIRYQRIRKGSFDRFLELTRSRVWPWEEKLGARPLGQWKVVFPRTAGSSEQSRGTSFMTAESADYDEAITMTRYASRAHYEAMASADSAAHLGGNGPDWQAWRSALEEQAKMTSLTRIEVAQGLLHQSPPVHSPGLPETYRRIQ